MTTSWAHTPTRLDRWRKSCLHFRLWRTINLGFIIPALCVIFWELCFPLKKSDLAKLYYIIFHQPRFPWNKGNSLTKPPIWGEVVWFPVSFCSARRCKRDGISPCTKNRQKTRDLTTKTIFLRNGKNIEINWNYILLYIYIMYIYILKYWWWLFSCFPKALVFLGPIRGVESPNNWSRKRNWTNTAVGPWITGQRHDS